MSRTPSPFTALLRLVPLAVALGLAAVPAAGQGLKIAVVDIDRVALESPAGKALQSRLETFSKEVQKQLQEQQTAAEEIRRKAVQGTSSLSQERLAELEEEYENAVLATRRFQQDKQREADKMRQEGLKKIEEELRPIFEKLRDAEGYDLILNNVPGVVVIATPKADITPTVIERLKAAAGGG